MKVILLALVSVFRWAELVVRRVLHLNKERVGSSYSIDQGGTYTVFRETDRAAKKTKDETVLVVGFRLKLLHSNALLHWLFQRVCICTTPFWSGFKGFRVKLWMVDTSTKNYLGIYQWAGKRQARTYVDALTRILRPLSTPGSVWYALYLEPFGKFVDQHKVIKG